MHIGMLWFDNTPDVSLKVRIEKAADYYRRKYHQEPNLCLLNPSMLEAAGGRGKGGGGLPELTGMTVRAYAPVLPGHLWIGLEENN
ncbi:MAG TPA: hypothetical protein VMJ64_18350 [Anaerolineales bacterium]|nr:hypothetical protein [Anaerolineales bacterium]